MPPRRSRKTVSGEVTSIASSEEATRSPTKRKGSVKHKEASELDDQQRRGSERENPCGYLNQRSRRKRGVIAP